MLYRFTDHSIYEVWNEHTAESVFWQGFSGRKPKMKDLIEICVVEEWGFKETNALKEYIRSYIHVSKFNKFYTDGQYVDFQLPKRRKKKKKRVDHLNN